MKLTDIHIAARHRQHLGDLAQLAESIRTVGLLQPVVVLDDGTLVAGQRRLEAARLLGWTEIPARVVPRTDLDHWLVRAEHAENVVRLDFAPSELVAIGRVLEPAERERAAERRDQELKQNREGRGGKFPQRDDAPGKTRDVVARALGVSGKTYEKAKAVVEAAEQDPGLIALVEAMDQTGRVDRAYRQVRAHQAEQEQAAAIQTAAENSSEQEDPTEPGQWRIITADLTGAVLPDESVDVILTDPPYGQDQVVECCRSLGVLAARVLKPGGSCFVMIGQSYLPDVIAALAESLRWHWVLAYLTPGGQAVQLWDRRVNCAWKPVLWFTRDAYRGPWIGDVSRSAPNDNDKRFHHWGQSESGMLDLVERVSRPGDLILDPFCGGGTTGVAAIALGRRFIGIERDAEMAELSRRRLAR